MPSPDDDPATSRTHKPLGNDQTSQGHAENETHERTLLAGRNHHAQEGFDAATDDAIAKFLEPFADTFAVLHDVALTELPASEVVPELDELDVEVLHDATAIVEAFVEGGTSRDVATEMLRGALSFSTQPAFVNAVVKAIPAHVPNAVTGRVAEGIARARAAIPVYAAQGRAFLARTGRTLPRNRDTFLIAAAVTGAAALIAWAIKEDKADRDKMLAALRQRQLDELAAHQAQLLEDLNQDRLLFATERTEEATQALGYLSYVGLTRLSALHALVADNDDYTTYSPADRNVVAELVALAQITAVVIASTRRTNVAHNDHDTDAHAETLHAAQELLNRYATDQNPGSPGTGTAIAAATAVTLNTATHREQLAYLRDEQDYMAKLAKRCEQLLQRCREGFIFEQLHELTFNLNAIDGRSGDRARTTDRDRRPHDAVDIEILNSNGKVVGRTQAKVVDSNSNRLAKKNGLTDPKYAGQDLLLPTDHLLRTQDLLGKALDRPEENIRTAAYKDIEQRITDTIKSGRISSDPLTTGDLTEAANDLDAVLPRLVQKVQREQAVTARFTAIGTAAAMTLATDVGSYVINEGTFDGFSWAEAAVGATRTSIATVVATSAVNHLQSVAQLAVDSSTANGLQESLAHGDHGPALTQAAVAIAAIAHGLTTNRLTPKQAALATAETITQSTAIWACMAVARRTIPDPETSAIVGGVAGQIASQLISQGVQIALLGRDPNPGWDDAYEALLSDTAALEFAYAAEREELAELTAQVRARFAEQVQPALERLDTDHATALIDLVAIADHFGGVSLFDSIDAFDEFMDDPTTTLVLDLGHT